MTAFAWAAARNGIPGEALLECLAAAVAAPSIHNTQPWRFRVHDETVDVLADHHRRLDVIDARGRELLISVGAAVLNLRVAMLAHGRLPMLLPFPDPHDPELVARVTAGPFVRVTGTARTLARAIPRRHTNRRPFANLAVPDGVLAELVAAARTEHAVLTVAESAGRDAIISVVRTAEAYRRAQPAYREELGEWTGPVPGRADGIPPETFGPWSAAEAVPLRDFGLVHPARRRRTADFEPAATIAVLSTAGDSPREWVQAGQALQRVLLTATARGLASTPMTQPLELEPLRQLLVDPASGFAAQVILRLGYGPPCAPSPRRPLDEVLIRT